MNDVYYQLLSDKLVYHTGNVSDDYNTIVSSHPTSANIYIFLTLLIMEEQYLHV